MISTHKFNTTPQAISYFIYDGRAVRLLLHLIAQQAGFSGMDFSNVDEKGKSFDAYIAAIHKGMSKEYKPMATILEKTIF